MSKNFYLLKEKFNVFWFFFLSFVGRIRELNFAFLSITNFFSPFPSSFSFEILDLFESFVNFSNVSSFSFSTLFLFVLEKNVFFLVFFFSLLFLVKFNLHLPDIFYYVCFSPQMTHSSLVNCRFHNYSISFNPNHYHSSLSSSLFTSKTYRKKKLARRRKKEVK